MKHPKEERERWLKQAAHDLEVAQLHVQHHLYADACYYAEQTAQKALKGYLYGRGERLVIEHAIRALLQLAANYDPRLASLVSAAALLDQYYIPTRYPDALAFPAVPFESYTEDQAREAVSIAERILTAVREA